MERKLTWAANPVGQIIKLDHFILVDMDGLRDYPVKVRAIVKTNQYGGGYRIQVKKKTRKVAQWISIALCVPFEGSEVMPPDISELIASRKDRLFGRIV